MWNFGICLITNCFDGDINYLIVANNFPLTIVINNYLSFVQPLICKMWTKNQNHKYIKTHFISKITSSTKMIAKLFLILAVFSVIFSISMSHECKIFDFVWFNWLLFLYYLFLNLVANGAKHEHHEDHWHEEGEECGVDAKGNKYCDYNFWFIYFTSLAFWFVFNYKIDFLLHFVYFL